jgi:hypothetical protein
MQGHVTHPLRGPQKVADAKTSHINYTTLEDISEGEQVLTGVFSLNGHPIVILLILVPLTTSSVRHAPRVVG